MKVKTVRTYADGRVDLKQVVQTQILIMQTKMQAPPVQNGSYGGKQVTLHHKPH